MRCFHHRRADALRAQQRPKPRQRFAPAIRLSRSGIRLRITALMSRQLPLSGGTLASRCEAI